MSLASFVGYPSGVAAALGLELVNAGCSGEATGGFVSATGEDNGCRPDKAKGRLHTVYTSTQLDFAIDFLKRHAGDAQPPALVTLDLGGNDLFLLQDRCNGNGLCEAGSLPAALSAMHANVQLAFASLRGTGYAGPIVFLTSYVPDFSSTLDTIGMKQTNAAIAAEVTKPAIHGLVADGYGAMEAASQPSQGDACKAGLLIALPAGGCDVHPSPAGRAILEQAVLKALGK
jgi:lysophospholipase L1-like esterase